MAHIKIPKNGFPRSPDFSHFFTYRSLSWEVREIWTTFWGQ